MASLSTGSNTSPTSSTEDDAMPHVIVKLWPGKSEQQKRRLAQAITDDATKVLRYGDLQETWLHVVTAAVAR